jgi:hypothetical protein
MLKALRVFLIIAFGFLTLMAMVSLTVGLTDAYLHDWTKAGGDFILAVFYGFGAWRYRKVIRFVSEEIA